MVVADLETLIGDPFRALMIAGGSILVGLAFLVWLAYRERRRAGDRGARVLHVILISTSFILLLLAVLTILYENAGTGQGLDFTAPDTDLSLLRAVFVPVAEAIGISSLVLILRDLRGRG